MKRSLERRISRLERDAHIGPDAERASAILYAFHMVQRHPKEATDEHRALVAATSREEWEDAFLMSLAAVGGLGEAVRLSYEGKSPGLASRAATSPSGSQTTSA
jgi:hypothetical protein